MNTFKALQLDGKSEQINKSEDKAFDFPNFSQVGLLDGSLPWFTRASQGSREHFGTLECKLLEIQIFKELAFGVNMSHWRVLTLSTQPDISPSKMGLLKNNK